MQRSCAGGEVDSCIAQNVMTVEELAATNDALTRQRAMRALEQQCETEPKACSALGTLHLGANRNVPRDDVKSRLYYQKSCERDVRGAGACSEYANALVRGLGGPSDVDKGMQLLKTSCDAGNVMCCGALGFLYTDGPSSLSIKKDLPAAAKLFEGACELGDKKSCNAYARALVHGDGVERNGERAGRYAKQGCEDGYPTACATYGLILADGLGVPRNELAAKEYLVGACQYRVDPACKRLTRMGEPLPPKLGD